MAKMGSDKLGRRVRRQFTDEFRAGAVRLVLDEGKTIGAVARELDLTPSALSLWVQHARADRTKGRSGLTTDERAELAQPAQRQSRVAHGARHPKKSRGLFRQEPSVVFAWIDAEKAEFPITKLCHVLARLARAASTRRGGDRSPRTRRPTDGCGSSCVRRSTRVVSAMAARAFTRI